MPSHCTNDPLRNERDPHGIPRLPALQKLVAIAPPDYPEHHAKAKNLAMTSPGSQAEASKPGAVLKAARR